jgi:hypothetical protein
MYDWKHWYDEVVEYPNRYLINGKSGTITGDHGETLQEGTPQNEENFTRMENGILDVHIAVQLLAQYARENAWEIESGSVTLSNTQAFPFNDSQRTVALGTKRESTNYVVLTEVEDFTGNVGEIEISSRLTNGFKIAYTGSASSVTINYVVIGGYMK